MRRKQQSGYKRIKILRKITFSIFLCTFSEVLVTWGRSCINLSVDDLAKIVHHFAIKPRKVGHFYYKHPQKFNDSIIVIRENIPLALKTVHQLLPFVNMLAMRFPVLFPKLSLF